MNMTENGYGPGPGHMGRIPNFGKTNVNPMGAVEPPACIQNAMMTKDKKPFTYTPGGLDLSQIRTPSMARRMARQRSLEEQEQAYAQQQQANNGGYRPQGGPIPPPPPPPPSIPAPPPPPPLVIQAPNVKAPKPVALGERPEIVIPENPIGMLRKTNSPYHWEFEQERMQQMGPVPKFVDKVPAPLTVKLPSQAPSYNPSQGQNNYQRQNYPYGNQNNQTPESPLHRPEAQYAHQMSNSPNVNGSPQTRELLVRQDSQFNKSPQPFGNQSPVPNSSPYSPSPGPNWRQPERRDSPASTVNNSPQSPHINRGPFSPNVQQSSPGSQSSSNPVFHTLPRAGQRNQDNFVNNTPNNYNNIKQQQQQTSNTEIANATPWRTNTLNRNPRGVENQPNTYNNNQNTNQQSYSPPWKSNDVNNNRTENQYNPQWKQENKVGNQQQSYTPPWAAAQDSNNNRVQENNTNKTPWRSQENQRPPPTSQEQPRYQSSISIPVSPRKNTAQPDYSNSPQQKEAVYVNQEPVYYCPDSPKAIPPWVKTQKEKTKTPPPVWCQRPLEGRRSAPRELVTPPRDVNPEPEWVRKSNDFQRGGREVVSPPKYQQTAQPNWSTLPSENRKSLPRDNTKGSRIIPIQMDVSSNDTRDQGRQGAQQPQLRIVIDMKQNPETQSSTRAQVPFSPPTQRIMRVLSPQLVRLDEGPAQQSELPTLNRNFQNNQENQPKTRIIPIQIEGASNGATNRSVYYHNFTQEAPPRQSKAFRVLQIITGTEDLGDYTLIEENHGFSDL